jgi:transcriptional regulator with XRE-family HTH domain
MNGATLQAWRRGLGWSQRKAARFLGTTQVNVSRWEHGVYTIPGAIDLLVHLYAQDRNRRLVEEFLYKPLDR